MFAKQSKFWWDFFSAMAESWKKVKTSNLFSSFIVGSNRNRSALVRELLIIIHCLSVSCTMMNQSRCVLVI